MSNYRKRCYDSYVSTHWKYGHSLSKDEYKLFYKVAHIRFKDLLPKDKSIRLVDLGCGSGHFLYYLQKKGYLNTEGIDVSSEQLDIARKHGIKNVKEADFFEYLPQHPNTFDVVIANDIIEHLKKEEVLHFLDIVHCALNLGGIVLISTINVSSIFGARLRYIDFTHEVGFTPESLMQVMRVCGFENVKTYGESPVAHDFLSSIRLTLWIVMKSIMKAYLIIEGGTGRSVFQRQNIFESRMFAVGVKKIKGE